MSEVNMQQRLHGKAEAAARCSERTFVGGLQCIEDVLQTLWSAVVEQLRVHLPSKTPTIST